MNNIEMILKLMEPELSQQQLAKLSNVLQIILKTSRNAPPNDELIERFIRHKKIVGLKETSLVSYTTEVKMLMKYYPDKNLTELTTADLKDYLSARVAEKNICANTLQTEIRYLSSFYDFLVNEEYIERNPTSKIERVLVEKKIKKSFSIIEINKLREACENIRDRTFIEFLFSTGCRISEVLALKVKDINFNTGEAIVFGKGHKERIVYLSDECMKYLMQYFEERFAQPDEPLFATLKNHNKQLTVRASEEILIGIGNKAGVSNVYPHRFRRTLATFLMDKGMPIEQIKEILGHERIDTTMIYCNVNTGKVKANYKEALNGSDNIY